MCCSLSGGELFEKVADDRNKMSESEAQRYIKQVCQGLKHMHEKNVVHLVCYFITCGEKDQFEF